MAETIKKSVYQIVGSELCVEADDGKKVAGIISEFIRQKKHITLSFLNVTMLTSAFLNTAIGLLYRDFQETDVKEYLSVEDLQPADRVLLKRVIETAKLYYKDPKRMEESVKEIMENN